MTRAVKHINELKTKNVKNVKRKSFLKFLWSCYASLPAYVYADPNDCHFPFDESGKQVYDVYNLYADLGSAVANFLSNGVEDLSVKIEDKEFEVQLLTADGNIYLNIIC